MRAKAAFPGYSSCSVLALPCLPRNSGIRGSLCLQRIDRCPYSSTYLPVYHPSRRGRREVISLHIALSPPPPPHSSARLSILDPAFSLSHIQPPSLPPSLSSLPCTISSHNPSASSCPSISGSVLQFQFSSEHEFNTCQDFHTLFSLQTTFLPLACSLSSFLSV